MAKFKSFVFSFDSFKISDHYPNLILFCLSNLETRSYARHRQYVAALTATGVTAVMGQFKNKPKQCLKCRSKWVNHEEKETDVNMALALLDLAYKDQYDHAFILTRDSDFAPALHKVKQHFPEKKITVLAPYNYRHSSELLQAADANKSINLTHLSTSLFPAEIYDAGGNLVVKRPKEYSPPKGIIQTASHTDIKFTIPKKSRTPMG